MKRIDDPSGYRIIDYENAPFNLDEVGHALSQLEYELWNVNEQVYNLDPYIKIFMNDTLRSKLIMRNGFIGLNGRLYGIDTDVGIDDGLIFILTLSFGGMSMFYPNPFGGYTYRTPQLAGKIMNIGENE